MQSKLHIDIAQGVINIEGDPDLVREVYADFKDQLLKGVKSSSSAAPPSSEEGEVSHDSAREQKPKRRSPPRKKANGDEGGGGGGALIDHPKLDKGLDTSGLSSFYAAFEPKNHSEKILIFLKFLTESVNIESPNTDQVYTCYKAAGEKIPRAFAQAFRDTSSKFGYIDLNSSTDLPISIAGDNHFNHGLKKKVAE